MTEGFPPIKERVVSDEFRGLQLDMGGQQYGRSFRYFTMGDLNIFVTKEQFGDESLRWHISLAADDRDPTWEEIKHVQNALKPGVFFCVPMPPERYWFSIHEHAFHLEEVKDTAQIAHWMAQTAKASGR